MADRYLLESGAPDGYLLEDSSGVLILEAGTSTQLDGGDESGWLGLQSVIGRVVLAAAAIASGNAQSQTVKHQDEIPYATGNGVRYSQPYTQRAQVKPVFIQWAQGDEFPQQAAPTVALDDSGVFHQPRPPEPTIWLPTSEDHVSPKLIEEEASLPFSVKAEISLPASWPDETICRIEVEESQWDSLWVVPQIPVTPTWTDDELPIAAAPEPIPEESEFIGQSILAGPFLGVWSAQDEVVTEPPAFIPPEEDWANPYSAPLDANGIIWVTDDDIAPAFALEEIGWKAEWLIPKPFTEVYQTQDDRPTPAAVPQGGGGVVYDEISIFRWYQEDPLPILATPLGIDEEPWKPETVALEGPKRVEFDDEQIVPQPAPTIREDDYWLGSPTFLPEAINSVHAWQDEVLQSIRDEEPWIGASYPLGPVVQVSDYSDDIVPPPPTEINVEETYWLQPDPPRDVVTGWQLPLDINEDFPELSTPPTPPRVEILGGDPVRKKKKSPREEIRELLNAPSGEKVVLVPPSPELPKPLQPVAKVVPSEYLPPIGVLPVSEPPPPAFSDRDMEDILSLIHLGIL